MDNTNLRRNESDTKIMKNKKKNLSRNNSESFSKRNFLPNFVRRRGSSREKRSADVVVDNNRIAVDAAISVSPDYIGGAVNAMMVTEPHAEEYKMNHEHRGKAIILNHEYFEREESREGTKVDVDRLNEMLPILGFTVEVYTDLDYFGIIELLKRLSRDDYSKCDCIAFFVLTHGNKKRDISAKDIYYPVEKLWEFFTADHCGTLAGKPKLFFINACRGKKKDSGIKFFRGRTQADSASPQQTYKIPKHADFLIAYSTVDGFLSYRNTSNGTWFIQCLCQVFTEYYQTKDLLKMLTITSRRVAIDYRTQSENADDCELTQVPSITSMLIRDIYFNNTNVGNHSF